MADTHVTVTSTRLDNSHDVSEESVTRNLDNAPNATQVPDEPASQDQPLPETPSVFSRFFRSSGVTERQKAVNDDTSLPSQNQATFQARLLQLQFDNDAAVLATNTAELTARKAELTATAAEADARTAAARRTTKLMDLESREMDRRSSRSPSSSPKLSTHSDASPRHLRTPSPLPGGMNDISAVLLHLEAQRREDNRQREADRRAAEQQAAEREERHQAQFAALLAATQPHKITMGSYVVGSALTTKLPSFSGTGDWCAYLRTFERLAKAHTIPDPYWSNELFIKLEGTARNWYEQTFPDPDTFPSWSRLTSSMHSRFGLKYVAADAWADKCGATRQEGESGLAAIQRVDELQQTLALLGVPAHVGPVEERCYQLQRLLGPDEQQRWIAAANATTDVSDDAIRALETAAAGATLTSTGRQSLSSSVSVAERDTWFGPRLAHLTTFLKDQPCTPAGRRPQARVAAITEESPNRTAPTEVADDSELHPAALDTLPGPPAEMSGVECRVRLARADLIGAMEGRGQPRKVPLPPPEYFGDNATHLAANKTEFTKRKTHNACFACLNAKVQYNQSHLACVQHGPTASMAKRTDPKLRVTGAALPGKAF